MMRGLRSAAREPLVRGGMLLAASALATGGAGLVFWSLAARTQDPAAVGAASAMLSAASRAAAVASLGMPDALVRFLPGAPSQTALRRGALSAVIAAAAVAGALLGLTPAAALVGGPAAGAATGVVLAILLACWPVSTAVLAGIRRTGLVFAASSVSGAAKVASLAALVLAGASGALPVIIAAAAGTAAATAVALWLGRRLLATGAGWPGLRAALAPVAGFAAANLAGSAASLVPAAVAPSLLLVRAGPEAAAFAAVPMLLLTLLNLAPANLARSLFIEGSHTPGDASRLARRTLALLLAVEAVIAAAVIVLAPVILAVIGGERYAAEGTVLLRLLAVAAVIAVPNWVIDTLLNIRRDRAGYAIANVGGSAALLFALLMSADSVTGLGVAWIAGQSGYLLVAGSVLLYRRRFAV
jgi:O-antigen/teichoic acid export membrane protein